jgi:hypothetical protein
MAVRVYWDEELRQCLRVELRLPWNWHEFQAAAQEARDLLTLVDNALGFIVDVREAGDLPPSGFLSHSRNCLQELPPLPMAFVARTPIMQIIFQPLVQIFRLRRHFYFVQSIEDAREILQQSTLQDILR